MTRRQVTPERELVRLVAYVEGGYRHGRGRPWARAVRGWRRLRRGSTPPTPPAPATLEHPTDAAFLPGDVVFEVPVAWCRYPFGFGHGPGAWNPWQATAQQLLAEPATHPDDTVLAAYFARFQPATLAEVLFAEPRRDVPAGAMLWRLTTHEQMDVLPWAPELRPWPPRAPGQEGRNAGFGPAGDAILDLEVWRLRKLTASMASAGFRANPTDMVRGAFVSDGDRHRFVLRAGFHRVAVAGALGIERIPVRFAAGHPRLVTPDQVDLWPLVRRGVFDRAVALAFVRRLLEEDGSDLARVLGFVPT